MRACTQLCQRRARADVILRERRARAPALIEQNSARSCQTRWERARTMRGNRRGASAKRRKGATFQLPSGIFATFSGV
eukprot:6206014-Pleurochrysis_carterae.AAC.1